MKLYRINGEVIGEGETIPAIIGKNWPSLREVNLEGAYLNGANLGRANLERANLYGADLEGAYLREANLERANLYGANLYGADLEGAYLREANLERVNLYGADLRGANLNGANLRGANLYRADLEGANLEGADLREANLERANLGGANLEGTCLDPIAPIPETDLSEFDHDLVTGELIGYRSKTQPFVGGPDYEVGREYTAPFFSASVETECHPGLYLCPSWDGIVCLSWDKTEGNVIEVRAKPEDTIRAGSKYRTKKFRVVGQISDLHADK